MHIRSPIEWGLDQFKFANPAVEVADGNARRAERAARAAALSVRRIAVADVAEALAAGWRDFRVQRTDVIFLCVVYPVIGLLLGRLAAEQQMLPLLFPLASGFALVGPLAAVGLYEMSRRREQGTAEGWKDAFGVLNSPSLGGIMLLGLLLAEIFVVWLFAAYAIYEVTLGPEPPASMASFAHDVVATGPGWELIVIGIGVGFLFAVLAMAISVVAFPLLLDRDVGLAAAVATSIRAVRENPAPMACWGLIVAGALVAGSVPLFLGLIVVLPVLGHATWHLYRKVVATR
jgi:uncharacterized membrane protein